MSARSRTGSSADAPPSSAHPGPNGAPRWEEWFANATSAQQQEMLTLACQQGLLYLHQLPPLGNGVAKQPPPDNPDNRLAQILAGNVSALPPLTRVEACVDQELDAAQREAIARALSTPDVFLIEGLPGSGKTTLAAGILRQACRQGLRVLFLAQRAGSLDAALLRLTDAGEVFALRHLAADEITGQLPAAIAALTPAQRAATFPDQLKRATQHLVGETQRHGRRLDVEKAVWARLQQLLEVHENLQTQISRLDAEVNDAAPPEALSTLLVAESQRNQVALAALVARRADAEAKGQRAAEKLRDTQGRIRALRPLVEARQRGRWWTWNWWRSLFRGNVRGRMADLEEQERQARTEDETAREALQQLEKDQRHAQERHDAEKQRLRDEHLEERRQALAEPRRRLRDQQAQVEKGWREALTDLQEAHRPSEIAPAALAAAHALWLRGQDGHGDRERLARQWAQHLEASAADLAKRLHEWANIVAAPLEALPAEYAESRFDLLVLEDAHLVTEAEMLRLARRASRWVLIADHQPDTLHLGRKDSPVRLGEANQALRSRCFHKLWQHLHGDLTRLHYVWTREQGRLCCHLRSITPDEENKLEIEHLADFPEVELRILPVPQPALAQILFPAEMTLAQAKQFVFRELQEVPIQRLGRTAWIREEAHRVVCHLAPHADANGSQPVELATGLCEWANEGYSSHLEFDKAAGWTRQQAELWLQQHLRLRDAGRTMFLGVSYRAKPALARIAAELLFPELLMPAENRAAAPGKGGGCAGHGSQAQPSAAAFTLVPVPLPVSDNGRAGKPGASSPAWPREGAGLEIDLTAIRTAERIPADLRAMLPRRGFANYQEAQAVVKHLERLAARRDRQAAAALDDVAVIALYQGQVELIRKLLDRSEMLKGVKMALGLPDLFRQREFATVLISVTRSHSHRAVALGDHPADLALALTRARDHVVLFADPGNLIKRAGWHGPLEHLDAASAALEGQRIAQLARYLQGQGEHQEAFHIEA